MEAKAQVREKELAPYIIYIRDYDKMINLNEDEYQKELSEIRQAAIDNMKHQSNNSDSLETLANDAIEGNIDALEVYVKLVNEKKKIESLMKEVLESALHEFDMYEEKTVVHKGFEIRKTQSARYDFKHIPQWSEKKEELSKIENYAKIANNTGNVYVIPETGEVIEPATKTYSSFGLAIKPAKK
jgi:chaperonin cofactor prefoldin